MLKNLIVFDKRFETNSKITHALGLKNLSFICSFKNLSELDEEIFSVFVSSYNNDKLLTTKKFDVTISPNSELLNSKFNIELDEAYTDVKAFIFKDFIPICDEFSLNVGNSEENPYLIKNEYDFCYSLHENRYKYYKLDSDINLNASNYEAFHLYSNIDGNNHTITVELSGALFNSMKDNSSIKNLVLNGNINSRTNESSLGSLIRILDNCTNVTLENIHSSCKLVSIFDINASQSNIGGIIGIVSNNKNFQMKNICFTGNIEFISSKNDLVPRIGGIFGTCDSDINDVLFKGEIIASGCSRYMIGGIVGAFSGENITNAVSFANFTNGRSGSIVSFIFKNNFEIKNSYAISSKDIPFVFTDQPNISNTKFTNSYSNKRIISKSLYSIPIIENIYENVDFDSFNQDNYVGFDFEKIWEWDGSKPILKGIGYFYELQTI